MKNKTQTLRAKYIGPDWSGLDHGKYYVAVGYVPDRDLVAVRGSDGYAYLYSPKIFEYDGDYKLFPNKMKKE